MEFYPPKGYNVSSPLFTKNRRRYGETITGCSLSGGNAYHQFLDRKNVAAEAYNMICATNAREGGFVTHLFTSNPGIELITYIMSGDDTRTFITGINVYFRESIDIEHP